MRSISLLLGLFSSVLGSIASLGSEPERPNILLICVDDLKPQLGCYGDPIARTPSIDRLANQGIRFTAAYCNQAVCSPSRNALLASLRPQTLGIYDLPTHFRRSAPNAITMPQFFKQHGYRSEALGKIFHVGHGNIDDSMSWSIPSWRPSAPSYANKESLENPRTKSDKSKGRATEAGDVADDFYSDGKIAEEAIRRLEGAAQRKGEPFFLAVGFLKPHLPFVAPKKYWDLYDPKQLTLPTITKPPLGAPEYAPTKSGELYAYSGVPEKGPLTDDQTRHLIHGYYAATSYTDHQIGRVLEGLEKTGLRQSTIVLLWGDHGWHLGDHGMWCKHSNYEQAARIPVIISVPGGPRNATSNAILESVDIFPTLTDLAGLPSPSSIDGKSFASSVRQPKSKARDHAIHVYPRGSILGRAIRTERYRLVEWKKPGDNSNQAEWELYDYESDPLETKNLASDQPDTVRQLRTLLEQHPEAKPQIDPSQGSSKTTSSSNDRVALFKKKDTDQDGFLTRDEFLRGQPDPEQAPKRFPKFDKNGDGKLSQDEFVSSGK